jgi:hypothetical protein
MTKTVADLRSSLEAVKDLNVDVDHAVRSALTCLFHETRDERRVLQEAMLSLRTMEGRPVEWPTKAIAPGEKWPPTWKAAKCITEWILGKTYATSGRRCLPIRETALRLTAEQPRTILDCLRSGGNEAKRLGTRGPVIPPSPAPLSSRGSRGGDCNDVDRTPKPAARRLGVRGPVVQPGRTRSRSPRRPVNNSTADPDEDISEYTYTYSPSPTAADHDTDAQASLTTARRQPVTALTARLQAAATPVAAERPSPMPAPGPAPMLPMFAGHQRSGRRSNVPPLPDQDVWAKQRQCDPPVDPQSYAVLPNPPVSPPGTNIVVFKPANMSSDIADLTWQFWKTLAVCGYFVRDLYAHTPWNAWINSCPAVGCKGQVVVRTPEGTVTWMVRSRRIACPNPQGAMLKRLTAVSPLGIRQRTCKTCKVDACPAR